MNNYIHIIIIFVVATLIGGSHSFAQGTKNTKSDYDAGIAAYQRGHYRVALYDFESRAKRGDSIAQFCLAYMLQHGYGVKGPKSVEAQQWYTKAAEQGHAPAQNNLGVIYVRLAESAAEKYQKAESEAEEYRRLESIIDFENAKKPFQPENTENLENAKKPFQLENTENLENAKKWFQMAAKQDYAPAQFNFYIMAPDDHLEWLKKAAAQNYAPAQNEMYYNDPKNEGAVEWLKKAAAQNYAPAQNELGVCYENGVVMKQNYEKAFEWYQKAAEQGYVGAYFNLAQNYRLGEGVNKNWKEAVRWYRMAAAQGDAEAQNNLAAMYKERVNKRYSEKDKKGYLEIASRWLLRAAQQDGAIAQKNIGAFFEKGIGKVPQDNSEAYYWYSLAIRNEESRRALRKAEDDKITHNTAEAQDRVAKLLSYPEITEIKARIENWEPKQLSVSGTGFYVGKHFILTNAHVVINQDTNSPWDEFRIPYRHIKLIDWDSDVDLALLYDKRGNTSTATFREEDAKLREKVTVFGYPKSSILSYEGNSSSGEVSGTSYKVNHPQFENRFQYNAPTQRGNSGGPVLDSAGNVIGVYASQIVDYGRFWTSEPSIGALIPETINLAQNINFAIKCSVVKDFLSNQGISFLVSSSEKSVTRAPEDFTVPVLCFENKGSAPLEVEEIHIENLWQ